MTLNNKQIVWLGLTLGWLAFNGAWVVNDLTLVDVYRTGPQMAVYCNAINIRVAGILFLGYLSLAIINEKHIDWARILRQFTDVLVVSSCIFVAGWIVTFVYPQLVYQRDHWSWFDPLHYVNAVCFAISTALIVVWAPAMYCINRARAKVKQGERAEEVKQD